MVSIYCACRSARKLAYSVFLVVLLICTARGHVNEAAVRHDGDDKVFDNLTTDQSKVVNRLPASIDKIVNKLVTKLVNAMLMNFKPLLPLSAHISRRSAVGRRGSRQFSSRAPQGWSPKVPEKSIGGDEKFARQESDALVVKLVAEQLGCDAAKAEELLGQLGNVLPALLEEEGRLSTFGVTRLAMLCNDVSGLTVRLVKLKAMFPQCDLNKMVLKNPSLLTDSLQDIRGGLQTLNELFPCAGENGTLDVGRMAQEVPQLLDPDFSRAALSELERLCGSDAAEKVCRNPRIVFLTTGLSRDSHSVVRKTSGT